MKLSAITNPTDVLDLIHLSLVQQITLAKYHVKSHVSRCLTDGEAANARDGTHSHKPGGKQVFKRHQDRNLAADDHQRQEK